MEAKKPHPVIALLLKRMESHPEEFRDVYDNRWTEVVNGIRGHAVGDDLEVFEAAYRELKLRHIHEVAMDELLNGEERRAKAETDRQAYAVNKVNTTNALAQAQAQAQAQLYKQQYHSALNNPLSPLPMLGGGALTTATGTPNTLRLGSETLDEGVLTQIKRKLGL